MSSESSNSIDYFSPLCLNMYLNDFLEDFFFEDISKTNALKFLNEFEYDYILGDEDRRYQILRLFAVLTAKDDECTNLFLEAIQNDYKWLVEKIKVARSFHIKYYQYENLYYDIRQHVKSTYVDLYVRRAEPFLELRTALLNVQRHGKVVLLSDLGFGKKWLTIDVCSDYKVMKAMGYKIFWIDVGSCNSAEEDLRMLRYLYQLLKEPNPTPSPNNFDSILMSTDNTSFICDKFQLSTKIKKELKRDENKNSLLILANIQKSKQLPIFNLPCKSLLITRSKKIADSVPKKSSIIKIDTGFEPWEFVYYFKKYFQPKHEDFPKLLADSTFKNSKVNPCLLNMVAENLREKSLTTNEWKSWVDNLQNTKKFIEVIKKSLDILNPEIRRLYGIFAIFLQDEYVPINLLKIFWNERNIEADLKKLYNHSFLEKLDEKKTTFYRLPYVYRLYLTEENKSGNVNLSELHKKVLEYYRIDEFIQNSSDIEMFTGEQHDFYFFLSLCHHLREAGCLELFPKIYFDFGFLQQQIRTIGLLRTIANINRFEKEITERDPRRYEDLIEIKEFLLNMERTLMESTHTHLLQYALMKNIAGDLVYSLACQQVHKFPDRLWFKENGYFHQRRQVIKLEKTINRVVFLDHNNCLVFFDNDNIAVVDISLDSVHQATKKNIKGELRNPIDVRLFNKNNHVLLLNGNGNIIFCSLTDIYRCNNVEQKKDGVRKKIVAFDIEENGDTVLYTAEKFGNLEKFEWIAEEESFRWKPQEPMKTCKNNIRCICKIFETYFLVVDEEHQISVWYTVNSSQVEIASTILLSNILYRVILKTSTSKDMMQIVFVCERKVTLLSLQKTDTYCIDIKEEVLLPADSASRKFKCAALTADEKYLVLGTENGLLVYDMKSKEIILASNIGEEITCVDVESLNSTYKHIIACGSKDKKVLNIFALQSVDDDLVQWAHKISSIDITMLGVWLQGGDLFDTTYQGESAVLLSVDSKNRVHRMEKDHPRQQFDPIINDNSETITGVTIYNNRAYAGCRSGIIFNVSEEGFQKPIETLKGQPIKFIKLIDEDTLVASTENKFFVVSITANNNVNICEGGVKYCFKTANDTIIILKSSEGWHISNLNATRKQRIGEPLCCDLKNNCLFTILRYGQVYMYTIGHQIIEQKLHVEKAQSDACCIAISALSRDYRLVAIGGKNGTIQVYRKYIMHDKLKLLHMLSSHVEEIYDMKFSPSAEVLVSCSEQLCFWSVAYMLNNPLIINSEPTNSRYNIKSPVKEEVDATAFFPLSERGPSNNEPAWREKRGLKTNLALLSCIKFDGNKAKKFCVNDNFTKFHIIDSEGVCYILTVAEAKDFQQLDNQNYLREVPVQVDRIYEQINNNEGEDI